MNRQAVQAAIDAALAAQQAANQAANQTAIDAAVAAVQAANQAAIGQAVTAALAAQPPVPPPALAAPAPFAINPAAVDAGANLSWDWTTRHGANLFANMTAPIKPMYSGTQEALKNFLSLFGVIAMTYGWTPLILTIPDAVPTVPPRPPRNLITQYGMIPIEDIRAHAMTYVGLPVRAAQAGEVMASVIVNSLEDVPLRKLMTKIDTFTVGGRLNGPLMLKVLLKQVTIETRSTVMNLRKQLIELPALMIDLNSDIIAFNLKVDDICNHLSNLGQTTDDLLEPLFSAYAHASDQKFVSYIETKRIEWCEHKIDVLPHQQLMEWAESFYKQRLQDKVWNAPTAEQEQFIALTAHLQSLNKGGRKEDKSTKGDADKPAGKPFKKKGKGKVRDEAKWAWKDVAPSAGQPVEKTFDGKEYIFCPHHPTTKWVLKEGHKTGCTLDPKNKSKEQKKATTPPPGKADKNLQYMRALLSSLAGVDEDSDEGETDEGNSEA